MLLKFYVYKATLKDNLITVGLDPTNLLRKGIARVSSLAEAQATATSLLDLDQGNDRIVVASNASNGDRKIKGYDAWANALRAKFVPAKP